MNKKYKTINELIEKTKDVLYIYQEKYECWNQQSNYSMLQKYDTKITMIINQLQMLNDIKDMIKNTKPKEEEFWSEYLKRIIGDEL